MDLEQLDFDDILKMGGDAACDLILGVIGRELNGHDRRVRALASIKVPLNRVGKIDDMLKLLEYDRERGRNATSR